MSTLLLSLFPLPREAEARLSVDGADRIVLSTLRPAGLGRALAALRSRPFDRVLFALAPTDPPEFRGMADMALALTRSPSKRYIDLATGSVSSAPGALLSRAVSSFAWATLASVAAAAANAATAALLGRRVPARHSVGSGKRLAYLRSSFGLPAVGGSVGHTSGVIDAFVARGHGVEIFACSRPTGTAGVACTTIAPARSVAYPAELNAHRYSRRFFRALRAALVTDRPEFLYQRYVLNDLAGVRLARTLGVGLVLEYNGSEVWAQRHWGRPLRLERASRAIELVCLRHADLVVTVSEALRREVLAAGVPEERVLFYPNCVDVATFDPARFAPADRAGIRRRLDVPADACVLSFVGTFGRWHGADVLARAIGRVRERPGDPPLHFLFVGDGLTAPEVRSIVAEDIRRGRVTMAGSRPQDEVPAILAASDVLLSPHVPNPDGSAFFGSPTKLFEYMAMARPIVASDLDQVGRVLRGWVPGSDEDGTGAPLAVLVEPGDVASLAAGIERAVALDPAARRDLGERARAHTMRAFTWPRHVEAILERLRHLAEPSGSARPAP